MTRLSRSSAGALLLWASCTLASADEADPQTNPSPHGPGLFTRTWASVADADAWQYGAHWRVAVAPYAPHFRYSEEHRNPIALGVERQRSDDWLAGFSLFRNSFGQPSFYAYLGRRFNGLFGQQPLFFQASTGIIYGYKGAFKDKVGLNLAGLAPSLLAGVGWNFDGQTALTMHLLGDAGVMFQLSYDFR